MPAVFDTIVVGLGGMGSAALRHLARRGQGSGAGRGQRVLGIEQFEPGHALGSSHGLTRIIRLAYFEHPSYVPLLRRAFELWHELQDGLDEPLLHVTGGLDVGPAGGVVFPGSLRSCIEHGIPHDVLDATQLARRFPAWRPAADAMAVYQPDAGFLTPERCIASHLAQARLAGAQVHVLERVLDIEPGNGMVRVTTDRGRYEAGQVVLTAGPWMADLAPALRSRLVPERQVLGWFGVQDRAAYSAASFPVFVLEAAEGWYYGFPEYSVPGFKIGKYHHRYEATHPDRMHRDLDAADEEALRVPLERYFPAANGKLESWATCIFTNTPDEHFIIDRSPEIPEVLLVSACSGHGFKFCSVIGEICADLVTGHATSHDISLFRLSRFR